MCSAPGEDEMVRTTSVHAPPDLEAEARAEGLDPSGVPSLDQAIASASRRKTHVAGLSPTALFASVEAVEAESEEAWLVWGLAGGRPILFDVDARSGAEMLRALALEEAPTAIVEPWQVVLIDLG
jgi:precorrin isomerase